jgi:hypothetical protein
MDLTRREVAWRPDHPHCEATSFERGQLTRFARKAAGDQVALVAFYVAPLHLVSAAMGRALSDAPICAVNSAACDEVSICHVTLPQNPVRACSGLPVFCGPGISSRSGNRRSAKSESLS